MKNAIKLCPNCKSSGIKFDGIKQFSCPDCGWELFINTAAAVAGIIEDGGKILLVERNREPGKGLYDLPGGFVDPNESAEDALRREIKEELNVEISEMQFLCSKPNTYHYKGVPYSTCDLGFVCRVEDNGFTIEESEIASVKWVKKEDVRIETIAFVSIKNILKSYLNVE